uniref:Deoxyribonuclease-2-alpha n=1 Tax=Angiostrongylus costaricensis TaxID=334426 RepID=A0A0R3PD91_ANGCS
MFVAIKLPSFVDKWRGRGFAYFDSSQTDWVLSPVPINSTSSAIGATLRELYLKNEKVLKIAHNDDWPDTHKANGGRGHSKGVAVANLEGGFWLIHSVPNFPPIGISYSYFLFQLLKIYSLNRHHVIPSSAIISTISSILSFIGYKFMITYEFQRRKKVLTAKYGYPESGTKFAQSLLCISFDVDALPAISQYMRYAQVTPFIAKLPQAPYFEDVIRKKSLTRSDTIFTYSHTIQTQNECNSLFEAQEIQQRFLFFYSAAFPFSEREHKCYFVDLWHDLIAPSLRTPLGVETWRNGAAQDVGTQCGDGANVGFSRVSEFLNILSSHAVYDVTEVQLPSAKFSSSSDHSKWGVSMRESSPVVCIGDVNRQVKIVFLPSVFLNKATKIMRLITITITLNNLYLQCAYTCIRVFDGRLAHISKKDKVRRSLPGRDEMMSLSTPSMTSRKNCSSEYATVEESSAPAFSSTRVCP